MCFANGSEKKHVKVKFNVREKVEYGRELAVVGSRPELGAWDSSSNSTLKLQWNNGDEWRGETEIPSGCVV